MTVEHFVCSLKKKKNVFTFTPRIAEKKKRDSNVKHMEKGYLTPSLPFTELSENEGFPSIP